MSCSSSSHKANTVYGKRLFSNVDQKDEKHTAHEAKQNDDFSYHQSEQEQPSQKKQSCFSSSASRSSTTNVGPPPPPPPAMVLNKHLLINELPSHQIPKKIQLMEDLMSLIYKNVTLNTYTSAKMRNIQYDYCKCLFLAKEYPKLIHTLNEWLGSDLDRLFINLIDDEPDVQLIFKKTTFIQIPDVSKIYNITKTPFSCTTDEDFIIKTLQLCRWYVYGLLMVEKSHRKTIIDCDERFHEKAELVERAEACLVLHLAMQKQYNTLLPLSLSHSENESVSNSNNSSNECHVHVNVDVDGPNVDDVNTGGDDDGNPARTYASDFLEEQVAECRYVVCQCLDLSPESHPSVKKAAMEFIGLYPNHSHTLEIQLMLCRAKNGLRDPDAVDMIVDVLSLYETKYGEQHIQTLFVKKTLALGLIRQKKWQESLTIIQKTIEDWKCVDENTRRQNKKCIQQLHNFLGFVKSNIGCIEQDSKMKRQDK